MDEVIENEFYHIHRLHESNNPNKHSDKWKIGNKISFGIGETPEPNLLYERIYHPHFDAKIENDFLKALFNIKMNPSSLIENKEIQTHFFNEGFVFKYLQFVREIILEEVRQSLFPNKPSRLNGVWLSKKDDNKIWKEIFPKNRFAQKNFLVKFTGKVHKADGRWITNKTLSFESYYKNAIGYWNGEMKSTRGKPEVEYIGQGTLEILQEILIE